jgi:hypothetical protein
MDNILIWSALAAVAGLGIFGLALLRWVAAIGRQMAITEGTATSAMTVAQAAIAKSELLASHFHDHRVSTASTMAEIKAVAEGATAAIVAAENRLAKAMEDFGDRLDQITQRLDHILDRRP